MRVVRTIRTPWAPYSVTFSRDGSRLAIGGGSWYGNGGIMVVRLDSGESEMLSWDSVPGSLGRRNDMPPTVSGVSFSADDQHLAASTWSSSHHYSPTYLFQVTDLRLTHQETQTHRFTEDRRTPYGTGVLLFGRQTITRTNYGQASDVVQVWNSPRRLRVNARSAPQHLTNSQMIVLGGRVMTAFSEWRTDPATMHCVRAPVRLVSVPLAANDRDIQVIPVAECSAVTSIAALPTGDGFLTGGRNGELDRWSWGGNWRQERLRAATQKPPDRRLPDLAWATYNANSIVGLCSLCDGDWWASVNASGDVDIWQSSSLLSTWNLPEPGTPRSLAAHPDRPLIAVGVKQGGFANPTSVVILAEIEPFRPYSVPAHWPSTVVELAQSLKAGDDCRLPLSDALEDVGQTQWAEHFRRNQWHSPECWALDVVLGRK